MTEWKRQEGKAVKEIRGWAMKIVPIIQSHRNLARPPAATVIREPVSTLVRVSLRLRRCELSLQRLDTPTAVPELMTIAAAGYPCGRTAAESPDQHAQKNQQIKRCLGNVGQRPKADRYRAAIRDREQYQKDYQEKKSGPRYNLHPPAEARGSASSATSAVVQTVPQLLAGLEERDVLFGDRDAVAGPRIAANPRVATFD